MTDNNPGNKRTNIRDRALERLDKSFTGAEGSLVWTIRYMIVWVHEFIVAVNSMNAARHAQKQLDNYQHADDELVIHDMANAFKAR